METRRHIVYRIFQKVLVMYGSPPDKRQTDKTDIGRYIGRYTYM